MISIIQCNGCIHLKFDYRTGVSSVQDPCHGCFVTSSGHPSNYEPRNYTVTTQPVVVQQKGES